MPVFVAVIQRTVSMIGDPLLLSVIIARVGTSAIERAVNIEFCQQTQRSPFRDKAVLRVRYNGANIIVFHFTYSVVD
jgi:hypothetical protein